MKPCDVMIRDVDERQVLKNVCATIYDCIT